MKPVDFLHSLKQSFDSIDPKILETLSDTIINAKGKIIILGNGGSNAIASHIAEDYSKALGKPTLSFSDSARLTCYANDYGYDQAFKYFLKDFAERQGLVILISSSGNSKNIVTCAQYCIENAIPFISLTGFSETNTLKTLSEKYALFNIWINSNNYGVVELTHEAILHSII